MNSPRRQRRERRSLAGLVIGLGCFALSQVALALVLGAWARPWREPFLHERLDSLRSRAGSPTVVMVGSSKVFRGFRAAIVEKELGGSAFVFNLGREGAGPCLSLYNFLRAERVGGRPDVLLVEVNPTLCGDDLPFDELATMDADNRLSPGDLPFLRRYAPGHVAEAEHSWRIGDLVPWVSRRQELWSAALPSILPRSCRRRPVPSINDQGDGPYLERVGDFASFERHGVNHYRPFYAGAMPGRRAAEALRELVEAGQRHGRVVLVLLPESTKYRDLCPETKKRDLARFLAGLGVPVVDAWDWIADDRFHDGLHLARAGADEFCRRLVREGILPATEESTLRVPLALSIIPD